MRGRFSEAHFLRLVPSVVGGGGDGDDQVIVLVGEEGENTITPSGSLSDILLEYASAGGNYSPKTGFKSESIQAQIHLASISECAAF